MLLNKGIYSRIYRWADETVSIAYHTPTRSATLLAGDSAEVWWRLFQNNGTPAAALDYIVSNGSFEGDAQEEAHLILAAFGENLQEANLIVGPSNRPATAPLSTSIGDTVSPEANVEQRVGQLMADHHVLYSLSLETTYRCNEKCVHCYLPERSYGKELTLAEIDALLGEFARLGGLQLQLTGGEVGVRKDFGEILDITKKHGLCINITSNMTRFSDAMLDKIIAMHPKSVSCSVYSARPELHDDITRLRGSFDRSIASIRRLVEGGVPVAMKTPLMKRTAPHWREVEMLANSMGCGFQTDLLITATNDGRLNPLAQRVDDPVVLNDIYRSDPYRITIMNEPLQIGQLPERNGSICGAGASGLAISPNGDIRPCIGISEPIGQYPRDSLSDVWHHSPFFARWAELTLQDVPCGRCENFQTCSRCPGAWHAEHGSYTRPSEYNCFLARAWSTASQVTALSI